jgi:hypothetical protein
MPFVRTERAAVRIELAAARFRGFSLAVRKAGSTLKS